MFDARSRSLAGSLFFISLCGAQSPVTIDLVPWAEGLYYPTDIAHCGDGRLFVTEQSGKVRVITDSMTVQVADFLNIQSQVLFSGEQGLLGIAFDPDHANNGFFYVNYVAPEPGGRKTVVSRFSVDANDTTIADGSSEVVIYSVSQPFADHKAGDLAFDPDGHLYITFGDGGSPGDPQGNAQDLSDPLGDIIRIHPEVDSTYSIPADNPYVGAGPDTLPEIWASGFRNPYRCGFDTVGGYLWWGDVGQSSYEEVNRWPMGDNSGPNFGWRCYEGNLPYDLTGCADSASYVFPLTTHVNYLNGGDWCATIGGRVYRGGSFPRLYGRYLYADYCSGAFWSLRPDGLGGWIDEPVLAGSPYGTSSLAENMTGELFASNNSQGLVMKIVDHCPMPAPQISVSGDSLISTPAQGYEWYLNGSLLPGVTTQGFEPDASGYYSLLAEFSNGCVLASDTIYFSPVGLDGQTWPEGLSLFPNPAHDQLTVRWTPGMASPRSVHCLDIHGRVVAVGGQPENDRIRIALEGVAPGVHSIRMIQADGREVRSCVVIN